LCGGVFNDERGMIGVFGLGDYGLKEENVYMVGYCWMHDEEDVSGMLGCVEVMLKIRS